MGTHAKLNRRLGAFAVVLFLIVAALGVRLIDFQVVKAAEIQEKSLASRSMTQTLQALRGDILDSSGQVLAKTVFRYDVNAAPKNVGPVFQTIDGVRTERSVDEIALELSQLLGVDYGEIMIRLRATRSIQTLPRLSMLKPSTRFAT